MRQLILTGLFALSMSILTFAASTANGSAGYDNATAVAAE
jgi:hypothetical protein